MNMRLFQNHLNKCYELLKTHPKKGTNNQTYSQVTFFKNDPAK